MRKRFEFKLLKGCTKRLCYKALQNGRIKTAKKIHKTLELEEKQVGLLLKA